MNWKNWPYWLRGGIISLVIFVILTACSMIFPRSDMGNIFHWIILGLSLPVIVLVKFIPIHIGFGPFTGLFILMIPYFFVVGALIGWKIGKIKSKKVEKYIN